MAEVGPVDVVCGGLTVTSWLAVALSGAEFAALFDGVGVDALLSVVLSFVATTEKHAIKN